MSKILVTGASGFIGGHLIARLLELGRPVRALVRPRSVHRYLADRGVEVVEGSVTEPASLPAAVDGVDAVVHLVGLIVEPPGVTFEAVVAEGTRSLVEAAERAGVRRFVYLSAVGAGPQAASRYHRTKWIAEEAVRAAALEAVILRPSVVYGPGDEFVNLFARSPVPLIDGGQTRLQPIYVGDLVTAIVEALDRPEVAGKTFELGGPQAYTLREMVRLIRTATGRWLPHPPLPMAIARLQAAVFDRLKGPLFACGIVPPLTRDNLLMLAQDNVCDPRPAVEAFGLTLTPFEEGLKTWLGRR